MKPEKLDERIKKILGRQMVYRGSANGPSQEEARERKFLISMRSIRVWPIIGENDDEMEKGVREFLFGALKFTRDESQRIAIDTVRRTGGNSRSRVYLEVCVTFADRDTRESVVSR